jgi:hypothetical protein
MAKYLIQDTTLSDIATAIRNKTGVSELIPTTEMAMRISSISSSNGNNFIIVVNVDSGATVTATKGETIVTGVSENGVCVLNVNESGDWTIEATLEDKKSNQEIVTISNTYTKTLILFNDSILDNLTWQQIREISDAGMAKNYWSVGDCKAVHLSGTMGTVDLDETLYTYILGFDHNSELEGSGVHFGGFKTAADSTGVNVCLVDSMQNESPFNGIKYFNMNHFGHTSNHGGWQGTDMRYDILGSTDIAPSNYGTLSASGRTGYAPSSSCTTNPVSNTLMSCLPIELRTVIKPINKYTDNIGGGTSTEECISSMYDYLPLLSEYEIYGVIKGSNTYESNYQKQYEYYAAGNSKVKYGHSTVDTAVVWWTRSPDCTTYYVRVSQDASSRVSYSSTSNGISPIFMV